jgi:peroxiredoxin Q/BCP
MLGKPVPDFELRSTAGSFHLAALRGRKVPLYFYPKDDTPGCPTEAADFRDAHELLSDPDEKVCAQFGVTREQSIYGRKVRGIERSTVVIDEDAVLRREWRGVKVPGHVQEVLNFVKAL